MDLDTIIVDLKTDGAALVYNGKEYKSPLECSNWI